MTVTVSPVAYPAGQTFILSGQSATITATTDKDHVVTVTVSDGSSSGTVPVTLQGALTATVPAGSGVSIAQTSHGVFVVTAA